MCDLTQVPSHLQPQHDGHQRPQCFIQQLQQQHGRQQRLQLLQFGKHQVQWPPACLVATRHCQLQGIQQTDAAKLRYIFNQHWCPNRIRQLQIRIFMAIVVLRLLLNCPINHQDYRTLHQSSSLLSYHHQTYIHHLGQPQEAFSIFGCSTADNSDSNSTAYPKTFSGQLPFSTLR